MARFEVRFKRAVLKELRQLPKRDVARILARIEALADDPRPPGCEKLATQERYRVRQGVYRIVYEVFDRILTVIVVRVAHRRAVYRP